MGLWDAFQGLNAWITGSGVVAAGASNASYTPPAGMRAFVTGFEITGGGATTGSTITVTLTGLVGGTISYAFQVPTGAAVPVSLVVEFSQPIPAASLGGTVALNVPSFGAGSTGQSAVLHGLQNNL